MASSPSSLARFASSNLPCVAPFSRLDSLHEVLLGGGGDDFTDQLGELCGVLRLFVGGFLPIEPDLGIAFAVSGSRHREVHADLGALAFEVGFQSFHDIGGDALRDADDVLCRPRSHAFFDLDELLFGSLAEGAFLGGFGPSWT